MSLELDFTKSFAKLSKLFEAYNNVLRTQRPTSYRKQCLKSTHLETMKEILRFYGAYLYKNIKYNRDSDRRFWITNTGIAKHKFQHRSTIYRHIVILQQAGLITNKIFHGSNCGIEISIHKYVLVFKEGYAEAKAWIKEELATLAQKSSLKNNTVASCIDTDSSYLLETYNINKDRSHVNNFQIENKHVQETLGKKQGSKVIGIDYTKQSSNIKSRQETLKLGAAGDDPALLPWISMYTNKSWDFAQQILYPKHQFSDQQIHLSKQYIKDYFALISQSGFKNNVERLFTDFCERILLARKYIDKSPARFIPVPWVWFDKNFTSGFKGTLSWLKKVKQNRLLLKTKYENLSQLCTLYKSYSSQLSIHCYKTTEAQIKSLSDLQLTNLYYGCVAEAKNFNPSYLHRYYKT